MRGPVLAVTAVAAALLTACGQPASEGAASTAGPAPATRSAPSPSPTGLAALRPCELLSATDRSTAGLTSLGEEKTIGTTRACDWTEPATFGVTVTLADATPLRELKIDRGTGRRVTVGEHTGFRVADRSAGDGTCAVLLEVGEASSVQVDITNAGFDDTPLACDRADTIAQLIEPKLPQEPR